MPTRMIESGPIDPSTVERLVSAKEIAPLLGVDRSTVYGLHRSQGLPGVRIGSRVKFLVSRVLAWREARETIVTIHREEIQAVSQDSPRRGRMRRAERESLNDEFPE